MTMHDGTQIGPYRLLQILGEGGTGVVYLAEQVEPFRRRVALKVMKRGLASRDAVFRFESEREALTRMSHPGVSTVFDSGLTADGRPYVVMEYVAGVPITEFCNQRQLTLPDRLRLFTQVCYAVHHAHQKGILHRDIKPSNILVEDVDGRSAAKVIDFGVAKAMSEPLTPLFTEEGVLRGTPVYMSPEQIGAIPADVDTRSDVYSLGVLCYELLVDSPPLSAERLRQAAMSEMLRLIAEEDPLKPSARLAQLGEAANGVARQRRTSVRVLAKSLRGEVEWIVMRALEKEPARRYGSASELASDVERYLAQEPVAAGPPGLVYRIRKLARKHRAASIALVAVLGTLVFGVIGSTALYLRAERDHDRVRIQTSMFQAGILKQPERQIQFSQQWIDWHRRALGDNMEFVRWLLLFGDSDTFESYPGDRIIALAREAIRIMERAFDRGDTSVIGTLTEFDKNAFFRGHGFAATLNARIVEYLRKQWSSADAASRLRLLDSIEHFVRPADSARAGDLDAERMLREILSLRREKSDSDPAALLKSIETLGDVLAARGAGLLRDGNEASAAPLLREGLQLFQELESRLEKTEDRDRAMDRVHATELDLGTSLAQLQELDEAERLLVGAYDESRRRKGARSSATQVALARVIEFYDQRGLGPQLERYKSLRSAVSIRSIRDFGPLLLSPSSGDGDPSGVGLSVLLGSRVAWIIAGGYPSDARWGVQQEITPGGVSLVESSASRARQPFLSPDRAELEFDIDHLLENCDSDGCQSMFRLFVRSVVEDPMRQRALVFYSRTGSDSGRDVRQAQQASLAVWRNADASAERIQFRSEGAGRTLLFAADEPNWGTTALSADGLLYAYACDGVSTSKNAADCLLARVVLDQALERTAWQFYAGDGKWNVDWRRARSILRLEKKFGETISVHWNEYLKKYLAICTSAVDRRVRLRLADRPEGSWSQPLIELDLPPGPKPQRPHDVLVLEESLSWASSATGHPDIARDRGRVEYITYQSVSGLRVLEIEFDAGAQ